MLPAELRESIRRQVLGAGFDAAGFAEAGPAPGAGRFQEWIDRGHAGTMDWLARTAERRADPRRVVPGARTVIAVALFYGGGEGERSCRSGAEAAALAASGRGEIARYARGTDYHRVMERRLAEACRSLRERFPGESFRWYVDTGPVLERAWAEAAGLGWIGKNTCAIDPRRGSYFFIGVVITTLAVPPDDPATDHCGSCRLCLDSCPTSALVEPYRLDARRCISYLTIEHRGPLEPELREAAGGLVFGCDICQEVCPYNRSPEPGGDAELAPREENRAPPLEELALLERESFAARFPRSAVKRAKAAGLVRNALQAIGSSGRADYLPFLEELAGRPWIAGDPVLSGALEWARQKLRNGPLSPAGSPPPAARGPSTPGPGSLPRSPRSCGR